MDKYTKILIHPIEYSMKQKKYNIALLPNIMSEKFIHLSQHLTDMADQYLLGENSLPHVTLCQFFAKQTELNMIWSQANQKLSKHMVELVFLKSSDTCIKGTRWVALLPNISSDLIHMHYIIANIVRYPVNKSYEKYFPHLTLANIKEKYKAHPLPPSVTYFNDSNIDIDTFHIALGACDKVGQFTKVIYR